ncbi:MAG: DUF6361 family protein [bacterium]|nr:DUF6361 family protein [bacterium]
MTTYSPASSLGWLDFDAAATERVATLLRSLQEPTTLDVLGLGSVRDAFSGMLHPGTSYIQTKLRYFMFLPWTFQRIEQDQVAPGDFFQRLRHDEALLIDCLRHLGPGNRVIGFQAGRNLKRMPSSIYWGGLGDWGLRRLPLSLGEYAQRAAALGRYRAARDDDGIVTDPSSSMWAPLPPAPEGFLEADITFKLRSVEAATIVENIRHRQGDTLLAWLLTQPHLAAGCDFPWEVSSHGMRAELTDVVRHARCFSELTAGPQYAYNVLVARRARQELGWDTARLLEGQLGRLQRWVEMVQSRHGELLSWVDDLPAFWKLLDRYRIRRSTRDFIAGIVRTAVDNPEGFEQDSTVHEQIRLREIRLKGKRARLAYRAALENWNQTAAGGQLGYRWSIAKNYIGEIADALVGGR